MANTQINVAENGTVTLATAGKYCDRNIDVNVNVAGKPTQFINWLEPANGAVLTLNQRCNSTGGVTDATGVSTVAFPYQGGTSVSVRVRGCELYGSYIQYSIDGGTTYDMTGSLEIKPDEYGDRTIKKNIPAEITHIRVALYTPMSSPNSGVFTAKLEDYEGCILTVDEPIGNGGYTG